MTTKALYLSGVRGEWSVKTRQHPLLDDNAIIIKTFAVALNHVNIKTWADGFNTTKWPMILGSDVAGVVEAVGNSVPGFSKGDRVMGYCAGLMTNDPDDGGFQECCRLRPHLAARIPNDLAFTAAAAIPGGLLTAAGCLLGLNIDLRNEPTKPLDGTSFILVWGASSSVGSIAVQLAKRAGYQVFASASARHHDRLRQLGAIETFDRHDPDVVSTIQRLMIGLNGRLIGCIDAASVEPAKTARIVQSLGGNKLVVTRPFGGDTVREVQIVVSGARPVLMDAEYASFLFHDIAVDMLQRQTLQPVGVQVVCGGLHGISQGLEELATGVSGVKLVVPLSEEMADTAP